MTSKSDSGPNTSRRKFLTAAGGTAVGIAAAGSWPGFTHAATDVAAGPLLDGGSKKKQYYFISLNLADPFYKTGIRGMKLFERQYNVKTQLVGPQDLSIAQFAKTFREVVARPGTAGILTYAIDFNAVKPLYQEARRKGIAVINGTNDWGTPRASFVGESVPDKVNLATGLLKQSLGGKGRVGIMGNTGGDVPERVKLFKAAAQKAGLTYAGLQTHDGSVAGASRAASAFIGAKRLDGLWFSDGLSGSVASVIHGQAPKLKLLLTDVTDSALKAIKAGNAIGTLGRSSFDEEFYGFQMAYWWHNGYRVPDTLTLSQIVVTPKNVNAILARPDRRA